MLNQQQIFDFEALKWLCDIGADALIGDAPIDHYVESSKPAVTLKRPSKQVAKPLSKPMPLPKVNAVSGASQHASGLTLNIKTEKKESHETQGQMLLGTADAAVEAKKSAAACQTLDDLKAAIESFNGCPLRRTAKHTIFAEGASKARIMIVGDAPDADEDRQGRPFVGRSGALLDRMFDAIGYARDAEDDNLGLYLTQAVFWRPPGNRAPSPAEIAVCKPFVERHIALVNPEVLIFMGGVAAKTFYQTTQSVTRMRGSWRDFTVSDGLKVDEKPSTIRSMAMLHPNYILNAPESKAMVWKDLCLLRDTLRLES